MPLAPRRSRYKDTAVVDDGDGRGPRLAPWTPAPELDAVPPDAYQGHRLSATEVGFLDAVAVRFYGPGCEDLWWAVAYANGIVDAERETYPGQHLRVIPRRYLARFLDREGRVT